MTCVLRSFRRKRFFAGDRLPAQKPIAKGFLVFIHRVIKDVEPRFVWTKPPG